MSQFVNNQYDFFKLVNLDADGNLGVNVISGGTTGATGNGIYGGDGIVPLDTTAFLNGDFTFEGLDEDTKLILRDGNNGGEVHLFSDGSVGQSALEFYNPGGLVLASKIQNAGNDTRFLTNARDLVFSTNTSDFTEGLFIQSGTGNVGIDTINPNYKLDVVGTGKISEDLFVGDTVYVGNVIGTPTTNASLYIKQPSITGSTESPIIDIQVDDANSYLIVNNATSTDGSFTPTLTTRQNDGPNRLSFYIDSVVDPTYDTPGATDVVRFRARSDSDFIQNRDLYAWYNYTTRLMDMDKDGNLDIIQGGLNVNGTGNINEDLFVGDTIYVGNVTGTPTTNASLYITQPSILSNTESPIITVEVDDASSAFFIANNTSSNGVFTPRIGGIQNDNNLQPGLFVDGVVLDTLDTTTSPALIFRAIRQNVGSVSEIVNRNLFDWRNLNDSKMTMDVDGNLDIVDGGLRIGTIGTGTSVTSLGVDASGNVVDGIGTGGIYAGSGTVPLGTTATISNTLTFDGSVSIDGALRYLDGNEADGKLLIDGGGGVAKWATTYLFGQTQWSAENPAPFNVVDGTSVNGFAFFTNADKLSAGTTSYDEYSISTGGTVTATAQLGHVVIPYTGTPYEGQRLTHNIRVNFNIATGSAQNLALELRRAVNDSVIGAPVPIVRNQDEPGVQQVFLSYTAGALDPFVTGGFYFALRNDSGSNVNIGIGSIGILIVTNYQVPTHFP